MISKITAERYIAMPTTKARCLHHVSGFLNRFLSETDYHAYRVFDIEKSISVLAIIVQ